MAAGTFEEAKRAGYRDKYEEHQKDNSRYNKPSEKERLHTHYDNLKVSRKAPPEVIRAAYRALSQKYHPDLNPRSSDSARIMAIINSSYAILSDPAKRREHDLWIQQKEQSFGVERDTPQSQPRPTEPKPSRSAKSSPNTDSYDRDALKYLFRYGIYGLAAFSVLYLFTKNPSTPPTSKSYKPIPASINMKPTYVRPNNAPNGSPWPNVAAYVQGYKRLHPSGYSKVTVDNGQNDSDVFVKLVSLDGAQAYPVRTFYIPAHAKYTLNNVTAGNYDVRYRNLINGRLSRSEAFKLEEIPTNDGIQFSHITMTLYRVRHGNMKTYDLSEAEF